jgi:hypothetical protein
MGKARPLRRVSFGVWRSRDGRWTFLRHMGDPAPQRWFAYEGDNDYPSNEGMGHVTLRDAVAWSEDEGRDA